MVIIVLCSTEEKHMKTWLYVAACFVFILVVACGWVMNIIEIIQHEGGFTGMLVARVIGVFVAPLGAVLGYL